jgi:hypothetical protein
MRAPSVPCFHIPTRLPWVLPSEQTDRAPLHLPWWMVEFDPWPRLAGTGRKLALGLLCPALEKCEGPRWSDNRCWPAGARARAVGPVFPSQTPATLTGTGGAQKPGPRLHKPGSTAVPSRRDSDLLSRRSLLSLAWAQSQPTEQGPGQGPSALHQASSLGSEPSGHSGKEVQRHGGRRGQAEEGGGHPITLSVIMIGCKTGKLKCAHFRCESFRAVKLRPGAVSEAF